MAEDCMFNTNRSINRANPGGKVVKIMCIHAKRCLKKMQKYTSETSKWVNIVTLFPSGLIKAGSIKQDEMLLSIFKSLGKTVSNTYPPRVVGYPFN